MMTVASGFDFSLLLRESATPLVLISGIGLVILVVNARFMHVADRIRGTLKETSPSAPADELKILIKRARILRGSLASLSGSIVSTSLLVLCVISGQLTPQAHHGGVVFLVLSSVLIGIAAVLFFLDVYYSLRALELAIKKAGL